jgi:hypothetical protein
MLAKCWVSMQKKYYPTSQVSEERSTGNDSHAKLVIIARAANMIVNDGKEWKPDWTNHDQWKYYPWFYHDGGSSGFRFDGCDIWGSLFGCRLSPLLYFQGSSRVRR